MASDAKSGKNGRFGWRDVTMLTAGLLTAGLGSWLLVGQTAVSRAEAAEMIRERTSTFSEHADALRSIDARLRGVEQKLAETATEQRVQFQALLERLKARDKQ